jgi:hypothetical protein
VRARSFIEGLERIDTAWSTGSASASFGFFIGLNIQSVLGPAKGRCAM